MIAITWNMQALYVLNHSLVLLWVDPELVEIEV